MDGRRGSNFMKKYPDPAPDECARLEEMDKLIHVLCTPRMLATRQNRLAMTLVDRFGRDETVQVLRVAVVHAARAYDPGHESGASFKTFAIQIMIGYMLQELRRFDMQAWAAHKDEDFERDYPLLLEYNDDWAVDPVWAGTRRIEAYAESQMALRRLNGRTDGRIRKVMMLRACGCTFEEISGELGCTRQRMQQLEARGRERSAGCCPSPPTRPGGAAMRDDRPRATKNTEAEVA